MYKLYLGIIFASVLCGCSNENKLPGDESNTIDGNVSGPCVEVEREPVIKIESVSDQSTGENIFEVEIDNISFNGELVAFKENQQEVLANIEIDFINNSLVCTLPCAFLRQEGLYEFTVRAIGYASEVVQTQASYSVFEGGCPSYVDGGTEVFIELEKGS